MHRTALAPAGRKSVRTGLSVFVVLVLGGAAILTGTAAPASATTSVEQAFVNDVNHERAAVGRPALTLRSDLEAVARGQAARMASSSTLAHNPNLTSDVTNWRWVGENVGYGPDEPTVHAAFMASKPHRDNILDTDYTEIGIGVVVSGGRAWVAEIFRQPMTTAVKAKPAHPAAKYTHRLSRGSTGPAVRRVQVRLGVSATGHYGARTVASVRSFQRHHGLRGSGSVGRATWSRLF